jgi:hypothetical protein
LLAHRYFGDFKVLSFMGFAEPHSLELDLGEPIAAVRSGCCCTARSNIIRPPACTLPIRRTCVPSRRMSRRWLRQQDSRRERRKGKWVRVVDDMGFPAGGARTMTADLTGKLPRGHAAHSHHHESADLLGQYPDQPDRQAWVKTPA